MNPDKAIVWVKRNLLNRWYDWIITGGVGLLALFGLYRSLRFVFVTGRWEIIEVNLTLFMVGDYDADELWRPVLALLVASAIGGLFAGIVARRQREALEVVPDRRPALDVALGLAGRFWPAILGVGLLLSLTDTITPTLVVVASVALAVACRLAGYRLPTGALPAALVMSFVVSVLMVWIMADAQGWDDWGGLMLNVYLAAVSIVLCFPLGVVLALGRRSELPIIRWLSTAYIELFRGVPLIALLLMANVALGFFIPQSMAPGKVVRAIIVFILFTAAYVAEIVRGGLQSLPKGQVEAGRAMGMSPFRITALIVLPQALRNVIPALVGQFISLFKDTTLAGAAMGLTDLLATRDPVTKQDAFNGQELFPETLVFVAFVFWVGSYTMSRESQRLESKLGVGQR